MKKFLIVTLCSLALCAVSIAETDYIAMPIIRDIQKGIDNGNKIVTLRVSGAATIGSTLAVTGASTLTGGATVKGRAALTSVGAGNANKMVSVDTNKYSALETDATNVFATTFTGVPMGFVTVSGVMSTNVCTWSSNKVVIAFGATGITYNVVAAGDKSN